MLFSERNKTRELGGGGGSEVDGVPVGGSGGGRSGEVGRWEKLERERCKR